MKIWAALLRGINVGGHNKLPMAELRGLLEGLGYHKVRTYIQSGNCVFEADGTDPRKIEIKIARALKSKFGYQIPVMALSITDLERLVDKNPYDVAEDQAKTVHIFVLSEPALSPDLTKLETLKAPSETFTLTGKAFYLHAPDGIGRSKLAAGAEKALGVAVTARNLRSVRKVLGLVKP